MTKAELLKMLEGISDNDSIVFSFYTEWDDCFEMHSVNRIARIETAAQCEERKEAERLDRLAELAEMKKWREERHR